MKAKLMLEDGRVFDGIMFGHISECSGEVVFDTSMNGYTEIITDPSSAGKMIVMTYPIIGNYGVSKADMLTNKSFAAALIVREYCTEPSNYLSTQSLENFMKSNKLTGISGIDTRALTRHIRTKGAMRGIITTKNIDVADIKSMGNKPTARHTLATIPAQKNTEGKLVNVLDIGLTKNVTDNLVNLGLRLNIMPCSTSIDKLTASCSGVIVAGSYDSLLEDKSIIATVKGLLLSNLPVMGISSGMLAMGLASGCELVPLKCGHYGSQPITDKEQMIVYETLQRHRMTLKIPTKSSISVTHVNLNDNSPEGFIMKDKSKIAVQFYPNGNCLALKSFVKLLK